jgi:hypothetical protein
MAEKGPKLIEVVIKSIGFCPRRDVSRAPLEAPRSGIIVLQRVRDTKLASPSVQKGRVKRSAPLACPLARETILRSAA